VDDRSPIEVHLLCYWRDYLCAIWALKSFYHFADVRYPLAIHIQGYSTSAMLGRLRDHFPGARLITQDQADADVEPWFIRHKLDRLRTLRKANPFLLKLCDFPLMCRTAAMMILDSDILFFNHPAELLASPIIGSPFLFMRDCGDGYTLSRAAARETLGIELAPRINSGLAILETARIDLARCDSLLGYPAIADGEPSRLEQTLYALLASESGQLTQLSDRYSCRLETGLGFDRVVARHYAGESRPLLTREGMPYLVGSGFLRSAGARPRTSTPSPLATASSPAISHPGDLPAAD
jgi:hypothetical protein